VLLGSYSGPYIPILTVRQGVRAMRLAALARVLGLCGVFVLGALSLIACDGTDTRPASMTPSNPTLAVEGPPGVGRVIVQPYHQQHFAALPLRSMQNGTQISFNAPWPTFLRVIVSDPASVTNVRLPVITKSESPPSNTSTTGFARTDD